MIIRSDLNLEDRCFYYKQSRIQRKQELDRSQGLMGTKNYQNIGCYKCSGYNFKCKSYLSKYDAEKIK